MAIKAIIPAGQTEVTVNGLHQWDYGQTLEVHDLTLPALVEIHFACPRMEEAVVRSCATIRGVASAVIPDQCLEQNAPIVAWVYGIEGTRGQTIRTIVLPVIRRTKPAPAASVPTYISDKYTELVSAITEQVAALSAGNVTVSHALNADLAAAADRATAADHATNADKARHAATADNAANATNAANAEKANKALSADTATIMAPTHAFAASNSVYIDTPGIYAVVFRTELGNYLSDIICIPNVTQMASSNHVYFEPGKDGGVIMSVYGEDIAGYTVYSVSKLASYPEG